MKFLLHNELDGEVTEFNARPAVTVRPGANRIEVSFDPGEVIELRVDGTQVEALSGQVVDLPATNPSIVISGRTVDGGYFATEFINEAFRQLKHEVLLDLADFHARLKRLAGQGDISFKELSMALDRGQLSLLVRPHAVTDAQADHHLNQIIAALPALQRVVHDPRRHLKVDESVRPVSVVRRTGPAALRHLSQHSEHWESRTVAGLRPARLLAKVIDDDLDLYENRFLVSLIKRLHRRMARLAIFVETGLAQAQSAFDIECYADELADPQARRMLAALLPRSSETDLLSDLELFSSLTRKLEKILRVLIECEETLVFRSLRSVAPVQSPIRPTNILTMDPHYRVLFDLWSELDSLVTEDEGTGELPSDIELGYSCFCGVLVLAALRSFGFSPENGDDQICITRSNGALIPCGSYAKGDWRIVLETVRQNAITATRVSFRRRISSVHKLPPGVPAPQLTPELCEIAEISGPEITLLDTPSEAQGRELGQLWHVATRGEHNRRRRGREDVGVRWKGFIDDVLRSLPKPERFGIAILPMLSSAGTEPNDVTALSDFYLKVADSHPIDAALRIVALPSGCREVSPNTQNSVIRRLLNYGDSFFENDSTARARRCGILQLSPWTLNSLQRVTRLLETAVLAREIESERLRDTCPICEGKFVDSNIQDQGFSRECRHCGSLWGLSRCRWCSRTFPWLRLRRKPWDEVSKNLGYPRWIEKLELAAGTKAFPSFCESAESLPAAVPICPHCGCCARKDRMKNCPRCSSESADPISLSKATSA